MQSAAQVLAGDFAPPATAQGFATALWRAATRVAIGGAGGVPSPLFGLPLIGWENLTWALPLALVLALILWWLMERSRFGFFISGLVSLASVLLFVFVGLND